LGPLPALGLYSLLLFYLDKFSYFTKIRKKEGRKENRKKDLRQVKMLRLFSRSFAALFFFGGTGI
jgi:hypothetical protein